LAKVKAGDEVLDVERGKPIAKLVPLSKDSHENDTLRDLARAGLIRLGTGKLSAGFWKLSRPKDRKGRGLEALLADRSEGR
jgi:antitoxin (DNA-binding transcriptional repressor) of toxin-antitoxin stability system